MAAAPVACLPVGAFEWHGEHLPLGSDCGQPLGFSSGWRLGVNGEDPRERSSRDRGCRTLEANVDGMAEVIERAPERIA